jgi:molybdopterin synthase catalytic subunit
VGEASLFVRVQSKHRGPALAFCGALIDRMKEDVPIWKTARL